MGRRAFSENYVVLGKFAATTGSLIGSWGLMPQARWAYDLGYGYYYAPGTPAVVLGDSPAPYLRCYTTTGSYLGPFPVQPPVAYPCGVGCDWLGTVCFVSDNNSVTLSRWNGASWANWATNPAGPTMGNDTGWGRVFVVTTVPDFKIYEYRNVYGAAGSLSRSFPLNGWPSNRYMVGLAIGQVNASGSDESVFLACFNPLPPAIYEVSVGDITGTNVAPASLGKVKAFFR